MGTQQKCLALIFRCIQPEVLYSSINDRLCGRLDAVELGADQVSSEVFQSIAHIQFPFLSYEELEHVRAILYENMQPLPGSEGTSPSVFYALVRMGQRVMCQINNDPVCDFSQLFPWRNVFQELGQDIFTTAFIAYEDHRRGMEPRTTFLWDSIIKTNNNRLNSLLKRGIAENHCHLGGTTQNFPLSWACLMNYPQTHDTANRQFSRNLVSNSSRGARENVWGWGERLLWASYLRLMLFRMLEGNREEHVRAHLNMDKTPFYLRQYVELELPPLQFVYGASVWPGNGRAFVLDYALRQCDYTDEVMRHPNRLLSGERSFLYRCFRACFDGTFSLNEKNWFYLYLLIKSNFRAELVQVNGQAGFHNFMHYQNRKDIIYDSFPAYKAEAIRLSVNANRSSQTMLSYEARIAPRSSSEELLQQLHTNEDHIKHGGGSLDRCHFFYVYHFIKQPDKSADALSEAELSKPRNIAVRRACQKQAQSMARAFTTSAYFCDNVYGIDAANLEIGCRPEVFATEFRHLRGLKPQTRKRGLNVEKLFPHVHVTYHAGEDFLDLADGLRAIDEAIFFLDFHRGDRIGHALALGVRPEIHYQFKGWRVMLSKQELLDNLVWLIYRSQELDVAMESDLLTRLQTRALELLGEIYGEYIRMRGWSVQLLDYYQSMKLRGDDPELYEVLPYQPFYRRRSSFKPEDARWKHMENPMHGLEQLRKSELISGLYQCYHYWPDAKMIGGQSVEFHVRKDYAELMERMQARMGQELERIGIMVECNPTSNYLIGTFRRYDSHPIFRFNNAELVRTDGSFVHTPQLSVSINTDDLGVFDTSLEGEYAILAAALEKAETSDGKQLYTKDSIYKYLEHVRQMGLEQSFYLAEEAYRRKNIPDYFKKRNT